MFYSLPGRSGVRRFEQEFRAATGAVTLYSFTVKEQLKRSTGYKARLLTEQLPSTTTRSKHNSQTPESPVTHISCVGQCASHTLGHSQTLLHQNSARKAGRTQSLLDLEDLPLDKVKLNL